VSFCVATLCCRVKHRRRSRRVGDSSTFLTTETRPKQAPASTTPQRTAAVAAAAPATVYHQEEVTTRRNEQPPPASTLERRRVSVTARGTSDVRRLEAQLHPVSQQSRNVGPGSVPFQITVNFPAVCIASILRYLQKVLLKFYRSMLMHNRGICFRNVSVCSSCRLCLYQNGLICLEN